MEPFHFKDFDVYHDESTMKVGTDAILLATWSDPGDSFTILDVGTGSGVISLLLASRCDARIDAIEIDERSATEAKGNFEISKFNGRLKVIHDDFNNFSRTHTGKYDYIISNPPFFSDGILPKIKERRPARHTTKLTHIQLINGVTSLLNYKGKFSIVLPANIANEFTAMALKYDLFLIRKLNIFPKPNNPSNRVNMEFCYGMSVKNTVNGIIIRDEDNNHSQEYRNLVKQYLQRI